MADSGNLMTFVENQRKAQRNLVTLYSRKDQVIVIHYSCESFYDSVGGRTPRISSIACRNFGSGQTRSFSIHQTSELPKFSGKEIWEEYDNIERVLLDQFYSYVSKQYAHAHWLHWNMRDNNYGFPAIEHRYEVLGGVPIEVPDDRKHDLARLFVTRFGKRYSGHPRLESIIKLNDVTDISFLSGKDEGYAFKDGKFLKLHQSTLRKVEAMSTLFESAVFGKLKTNAPFWDRHGGSIRLIWEKHILTPVGKFISFLITVITACNILFPQVKINIVELIVSVFQKF